MSNNAQFKAAYPYQKDVLSLPVADLDSASQWYGHHFEMTEVERIESPIPTVILERNGTKIGFSVNGGDATQDGAAILVTNIRSLRDEFEQKGMKVGALQTDNQDDGQYHAFFVVAPDGLCYYFHEPI